MGHEFKVGDRVVLRNGAICKIIDEDMLQVIDNSNYDRSKGVSIHYPNAGSNIFLAANLKGGAHGDGFDVVSLYSKTLSHPTTTNKKRLTLTMEV